MSSLFAVEEAALMSQHHPNISTGNPLHVADWELRDLFINLIVLLL